MDYITVGTTIINNITFEDGRKIDGVLGGCGVYAYTGIRLFDDNCLLVSTVGKDYTKYYGEWIERNKISVQGLYEVDEHTMNSNLVYMNDGDYTDISVYGGTGVMHSEAFELKFEMVLPFLPYCKGVYINGTGMGMFDEVSRNRSSYGYKMMWEVPSNYSKGFGDIDDFNKKVKQCDIFSINRKESCSLFGVNSDRDAIEIIKDLDTPCFYRLGKDGCCFIAKKSEYFAKSIHLTTPEDDVDPTGCGNTSAAAAMWGFIEGYDSYNIAVIANTAAAFTASKRGPIEDFGSATREKAMSIVEKTEKNKKA
ncbi:MAG: carbohydrate kinase family protein [Ruminococcaceae bacterium]|nr:carbohydrate kinase family protein [Oscillospiraceae bacterium]